ncbi:MAG: AAA family ATPase [Desulfobacteraceae bacterium]|nr:AAA family ATPase [Desulfobacteraceae bacterium]
MNSVTLSTAAIAASYHKLGWHLVPIPKGTKGPNTKGWQHRSACIGPGQAFPDDMNMGLAHAFSGTMALDIDDVAASRLWLQNNWNVDLDALLNSRDMIQITSGVSNHTKLLFRMPPEHPTLPSYTYTENRKHVIQFRNSTRAGTTLQCVLPFSIHPDTGKPYQWVGDYTQVPVLPPEILQIWLTGLETAEVSEHKSDAVTSEAEIESALASIDSDVHRDLWVRAGMAIHAALGDHGYFLFDAWSAQGVKYAGAADTETIWRSFNDNPNGVTALSLFKMARESGWAGHRRPADEVFKPVAVGPSMFEQYCAAGNVYDARIAQMEAQPTVAHEAVQQPVSFWDSIKASNLLDIKPEPIETLVPNLIPMQGVTGLASPPGHGKSGFMIQLGWAMATESCLYNNPAWSARPGSSFILEAEDDRSEFHRRLSDLQHKNPEQTERYRANEHEIYFHHPANADTRLTDRYGNATEFVDQLIKNINEAPTKIECFLVGPMINLSGGSESNEDIQAVLRQLHRIGYECNCAVVAPHHVSKTAALNTDRSEHAARGGSSFTGSVRAQIHLQNMGAGEAEIHKIKEEDRLIWVGINLVKANGLPRMPATVWLQRIPHSATMAWVSEQPECPRKDKPTDSHLGVVMLAREILAEKDTDWPLRAFSDEYGGTSNVFGMGENGLRGHLTRACNEGTLKSVTRAYRGRPVTDLIGGKAQLKAESLADAVKHDARAKPATEVFAASVPDFLK